MEIVVSDKTAEGHFIRQADFRKPIFRFVAFAVALISSSSQAATVTLYDGAGLPSSQPWLFYAANSVGASQSVVGAGVQLQTTTAVSAGYSNYVPIVNMPKNVAFPTLDRSTGFELSFSAQLSSESHVSNDRAGFSVILLGSDSKGIELGFWQDEIWAQTGSPLFTHGAGAAVDTTQSRDYRLRIVGDDYTLFDTNTTLLSGMVQDYTAFGAAPYTLSNYIFLGDDTSSAGADVVLGPITLRSDLTAVPEPSGVLLCVLSLAVMRAHRRRRLKARTAELTTLGQPALSP